MPEYFKIEKNVPIPEPQHGAGRKGPVRSSLEALGVGDSVVIPRAKSPKYIYTLASTLEIKIATRQVNGEGRRIWRIK